MSERKARARRKESTIELTEVEKLTLENKKLKVSDLQKEGDLMIAQYRDKIKQAADDHRKYFVDLCEKNNKKPENVIKVDFGKGIIIFKD